MALIDDLIQEKYLNTPLIIEAFRHIKRADFVSDEMREQAEINAPLPIGFGQTISQPLTVAFMLELLQPKEGDKILDIGSGSGWVAALLAYIVSGGADVQKSEILNSKSETNSNYQNKNSKQTRGRVYTIERVCELVEFAKKNIAKYNFIERGIVEIKCADGTKGWAENAPYDKIHAAASAREIPESWRKQLKIGGSIVAPVENSILLLIKKSEKDFEEHEYPGFVFVPLIESPT